MNSSTGVVWFRRDLRLNDNPAWAQATIDHDRVVALYVLEPRLLAAAGPFRRNQLVANVQALGQSLAAIGGDLTVRLAPAADAVETVVGEVSASAVHVNADYSPFASRRDGAVADRLAGHPGVTNVVHHGNVVHPPGAVLTKKGTLSAVFTPFHRRWAETPIATWPEAEEAEIIALESESMPSLEGEPFQPPGEHEAWRRLEAWLERVDEYPATRDVPALDGTSVLSADLRFGTLAARAVADAVGAGTEGRQAFVRQLAWRDWWAHTLNERTDLLTRSVRSAYDSIRWENDDREFEAWQKGETGYPLVDAGMRQLAATGWMHNRVRMVCASFLVKDLLIDWRWGERHFRRLLVDGDPAQNGGNWQWVAGTGPDAAPYFRIFNPISQSKKFDPDGAYIRRWIPELAPLDNKAIHEPSALGPLDLAAAGITLGQTYPYPIVDHGEARDRTLAAYKAATGQET